MYIRVRDWLGRNRLRAARKKVESLSLFLSTLCLVLFSPHSDLSGIYGIIKKQKWQQKHKEEEGLFKCICTVRRVTVEVPIYTYVAFVEVSAK